MKVLKHKWCFLAVEDFYRTFHKIFLLEICTSCTLPCFWQPVAIGEFDIIVVFP